MPPKASRRTAREKGVTTAATSIAAPARARRARSQVATLWFMVGSCEEKPGRGAEDSGNRSPWKRRANARTGDAWKPIPGGLGGCNATVDEVPWRVGARCRLGMWRARDSRSTANRLAASAVRGERGESCPNDRSLGRMGNSLGPRVLGMAARRLRGQTLDRAGGRRVEGATVFRTVGHEAFVRLATGRR